MKTTQTMISAAFLLLLFALPATVPAAGTPSRESSTPSDVQEAETAIDAGDYRSALDLLKKAVEGQPKSADVHNLLGYSHRKLGNTGKAFEHYRIALELEPKHRGANEYLGELYLETGQLAKAEERLEVLDDACFFGCEEYDELKAAIEAFKSERGGSGS